MVKLFAMEDDSSSSNNTLLIDKVLESAKKPESATSLTADMLQQRQQLNEEIKEKLTEEPESSDDNSNTEQSTNNDDNRNTDKEDESSTDDEPTGKEEEDTDETPEDKEELKGLIGADLKEDSNEDTATESLATRVTLANIFSPIRRHHERYVASLVPYALESSALPVKQQPIVYVKESVIASLNNLVTLSNAYIENNKTFTSKITESVKSLNERITVFKQFVDAEKYHFTNKLINDKDILSNLSVPDKSDPRETSRLIIDYAESSKRATTLLMSNEFSKLQDGYLNSNFKPEDGDLVFNKIIPGFNLIKVHLPVYKNYLSTKIEDYQYYKLKVLKTEDLYNLTSISVTEDKELLFLVDNIDKLIVNIALGVDNLIDINTFFSKFIEEVKAMIYDIDHDKYTNLAEVGIDAKVQDFIKFKLAIEAYYINVNTLIEYLTSTMSVLDLVVELKE